MLKGTLLEPVRLITGTAVPLRRSDVDTDQIIPSDWLKRVERTGFGVGLFSEWRADPAFLLHQPPHARAAGLGAGANFRTRASPGDAGGAPVGYGFHAGV